MKRPCHEGIRYPRGMDGTFSLSSLLSLAHFSSRRKSGTSSFTSLSARVHFCRTWHGLRECPLIRSRKVRGQGSQSARVWYPVPSPCFLPPFHPEGNGTTIRRVRR